MTRKPDYVVNVTVGGSIYLSEYTKEWSAREHASINTFDREDGAPWLAVPYRIRVFLKPSAQEKRE